MPSIDHPSLLTLTQSPDYADKVCEVMALIETATDSAECLALLKQAVSRLGADAAVFISFIRNDAMFASYRVLQACDPTWGQACAEDTWFSDDPWLLHAMHCSDPIRASELTQQTPCQRDWTLAASAHGFKSAVIVPAPSAAGRSRVAVLSIGSFVDGYFEGGGYTVFKLLARPLAMELSQWWQHQIKRELLAKSHLTPDDLALLRHEEAGHCSKVIAAALNTEAKTIDCRFQRLNNKLGAPNRRLALRIAKLHNLI
ncbi:helix-turn-helix transcriptional regulator [Roseateles oligotrophus]|uniref:Autoinducer binding domain-containing protein n=1 Tax=Roseateles oligotrophus TaxID=1769250 RepID=A0ABT2Y9N1_9BURK|nr:autoinducer binding domain-containing protein [Roseateles oligotrophus]MCV2367011.1 autoinducer binding domain-containing protein [Roseateles oligotrophus]